MVEISVIIKDSERRYKRDFVEYEDFQMSANDELVEKMIATAVREFNGKPESVVVKTTMIVE